MSTLLEFFPDLNMFSSNINLCHYAAIPALRLFFCLVIKISDEDQQ